jgi:Tol biopolymer transport system component
MKTQLLRSFLLSKTGRSLTLMSGILGNKRRRDMSPTTIESSWARALRRLDSRPRLIDTDERISNGGLSFTPDGKAVAYPIRENGVDNLWVQPLDGSPGRQITHFGSEQIFNVHWSPDGKSLGILRGHSEADVVLLRDSSH